MIKNALELRVLELENQTTSLRSENKSLKQELRVEQQIFRGKPKVASYTLEKSYSKDENA